MNLPSPSAFTLDEVLTILRNVGVDITCGTCAEIAFTGSSSGHPHTCAHKDQGLIIEHIPANPNHPLPNDAA